MQNKLLLGVCVLSTCKILFVQNIYTQCLCEFDLLCVKYYGIIMKITPLISEKLARLSKPANYRITSAATLIFLERKKNILATFHIWKIIKIWDDSYMLFGTGVAEKPDLTGSEIQSGSKILFSRILDETIHIYFLIVSTIET